MPKRAESTGAEARGRVRRRRGAGAAAPAVPPRFYSVALSEAERAALPRALELEGMDEEIALLRVRLLQALEADRADLRLMFQGITVITKAVATRYRLSKRAERDLAGSIANVIRGVGDLWPERGPE